MSSSAAALLALRAFRSKSLSNNNTSWAVSRTYASTTKMTAANPKSGGGTASGGGNVNVQGKNLDPPQNVFKKVDAGSLGPGASKQSDYKNPEYFSYHNMSYTEMELVMAKLRVPQPSNKK
ncbi:NADH dehydrogenase [ubiquinone] flavoprotein 3, mitochondrial [Orchesella cincta]|uniref:NADH dehydrogenase [ubiquinone] flavoprotein 3, mitochondrial n=1 Tax=Orchesella cincta TaxID=48709 RepID=A0A1D2NH68_ORCCI|nr:NADH dehydrogenase [ubiquinone] flavoprotein 3, mitochondrial [Orchesella cincta]